MKHLPQKNAEHISVPFVARRDEYAPGDFFRLPAYYGCTGAQLAQKGPGLLRPDDRPAFLQEWLFFALIAQVLNTKIDARLFRQQQAGDRDVLVDTSSIGSLFADCASSSSPSGDSHHWNHRTRATLALDEARKFVLAWCSDKYVYLSTQPEPEPESSPLSFNERGEARFRSQYRELCLSFGIIGETLDRFCARQMKWSPLGNHPEPYGGWEDGITDDRSWGFSNLLRERMVGLGWCKHEVRRISATAGDLSSMYYISSFRFQPANPQDHSRCGDDRCVQDPWDGFSIHSNSCRDTDSCDRLLPDESELIRILGAGNIPLLSLDDETNLILTEHVLGQTPDREGGAAPGKEHGFVAISHAWSDGLGPSDGEGLPRCRLAQIREALQKDPEDGLGRLPFWIDSLCIPQRQDIRNRAIQGMAIQGMGVIYSRANTVLVLDSNLRLTSADPAGTSPLEAIVRVNAGSWCTRMWTLPEGVQARNVHFEFSDRLLSIKHLRGHYKAVKHNPHHEHHHVYKAGWVFSPSIFLLRGEADGEGVFPATAARPDCKSIGHLWLSLQWRRTARPQDETLCLARLLDLDPLPILAREGEGEDLKHRRMAELLVLMDQSVGIPPGMVFLPGPKLPLRGFAWAPRSWMTRRSRDAGAPLLATDQSPSFLTLRGLLVRYPGVQLHPRRGAAEPPCFWIPTAQNLRRWLRIRYARDMPQQGAADWAAAWAVACEGTEPPCIIRSRSDEHDEPEMALLVKKLVGRESRATSRNSRADVFSVKVLCRVWIQVETDGDVVARRSEDFRLHVDTMTWGEALDADQWWVVDGES